jgi:hypothetical protein
VRPFRACRSAAACPCQTMKARAWRCRMQTLVGRGRRLD